jgi:hypothetical protein
MDPHALSVAVRWLHVVAMAVAFGGAVLVVLIARIRDIAPGPVLAVAMSYERAFWAAAGVLVMTGIGNAAAFGAGLPAPSTGWGTAFTVKLGCIAVLVLLSAPRTVALVQLGSMPNAANVSARLTWLYGLTVAVLVVILAIAIGLAHG